MYHLRKRSWGGNIPPMAYLIKFICLVTAAVLLISNNVRAVECAGEMRMSSAASRKRACLFYLEGGWVVVLFRATLAPRVATPRSGCSVAILDKSEVVLLKC